MTIPKIIHYVWVGTNPLPELDRVRIEHWRDILKDWEFRFWNNDNVNFSSRYLSQAYAARAWNRVSDFTRMDALARFGGVYLDTDVDLIRPLEPLLEQSAFLGFQRGDDYPHELVNGAVFGATAGHWLPVAIRDIFNERYDGRDDIKSFAGPGMITKVLRENGLHGYSNQPIKVKDVTIYPRRFFYPYSWDEAYSSKIIEADTYAVHRWAESWIVNSPSRAKRFRLMLIKNFARFAPTFALWAAKVAARRNQQAAAR